MATYHERLDEFDLARRALHDAALGLGSVPGYRDEDRKDVMGALQVLEGVGRRVARRAELGPVGFGGPRPMAGVPDYRERQLPAGDR